MDDPACISTIPCTTPSKSSSFSSNDRASAGRDLVCFGMFGGVGVWSLGFGGWGEGFSVEDVRFRVEGCFSLLWDVWGV